MSYLPAAIKGGVTVPIVINPTNSAVATQLWNSFSSDRFSWSATNNQAIWIRRYTGAVTPTNENSANFYLKGEYDGTPAGSQFTIYGMNVQNRWAIGLNNACQGSVLGESITMQIHDYDSSGGGGGTSEIGAHFNVINCWYNSNNYDGNFWLADWTSTGPTTGQERFMGSVLCAVKYNATETIDATHVGFYGWLVTSAPGKGGGQDDSKSNPTSYRGRAAFAVNGWAGPQATATSGSSGTATSAWQYCFAAGIVGSPWLGGTATSKLGTGFYVTSFLDYGLQIDDRHADATGFAIYTTDGAGSIGLGRLPDANIRLGIQCVAGKDVATRFTRNDDASAAIGPRVQTRRGSASPAAADFIGSYEYLGLNLGAAEVMYCRDVGSIGDPTAGAEYGAKITYVIANGAEVEGARVNSFGVTAPTVKHTPVTVTNLPSASGAGAGTLAFVTDATMTAILGLGLAVTGGGSNKVPVYSDGTNWIII